MANGKAGMIPAGNPQILQGDSNNEKGNGKGL
jgi:hypothetical protein